MNYFLKDAEAWNAKFPATFLIPSRDERISREPGDLVKLTFVGTLTGEAERMWVIVKRRVGLGDYIGEVNNEAYSDELPKLGESVRFTQKHICTLGGRVETPS